MINLLSALILAVVALTKATPVGKRLDTDNRTIETFDNFGSPPRFTPLLISSHGPLRYGNIYVEDPYNRTGVVPYGMKPSSGNFTALYFNTIQNGTPVPPVAVIKSYPVVTGYTFDLLSWKYGCSVGYKGVALGVSRCYVAVFGYRAGHRVAKQAFSYLPTNRTDSADLVSGEFNSDFKNIDTVRFATAYSRSLISGASRGYVGQTQFDDLEYISHYTPNFTWPEESPTSSVSVSIGATSEPVSISASIEPTGSGSGSIEPTATGSTEPTGSGTESTGPTDSGAVSSGPTSSGTESAGPTDSGAVSSGPTSSGTESTGPTGSGAVSSEPTSSGTESASSGSASSSVSDSSPVSASSASTSSTSTSFVLSAA